MGQEYTWRHEMPASLGVAMGRGFVRAVAKSWDTSPDSVADFRGLVLGTHIAANVLRFPPAFQFDAQQGHLFDTPNSGYQGAWHESVGTALLTTLLMLSRNELPTWRASISRDGEPAADDSDVGLLWPAAVVIIAGISAATVAICYLGEKAMPVLDRELTRGQAGANLLAAHGSLAQLATDHAAREQLAGMSLPPNALELEALRALKDTQQVYLQEPVPPAPPPKDPPSLSQTLGLGLVAVVAAVGLLFVATSTRST